jgi:predicted  nucleic acid-binding Zn-ribbon protein
MTADQFNLYINCSFQLSVCSLGSMSEVLQLRETCSQLEDQVEQQQKVIRHLQAQQAKSGDAAANGLSRKAQQLLEQLQDENEQLKQQVSALQDDLVVAMSCRPGTTGLSATLQQQVLELQVSSKHSLVTMSIDTLIM